MHEDTNVELTTEFYTTLDVNAKNSQILDTLSWIEFLVLKGMGYVIPHHLLG